MELFWFDLADQIRSAVFETMYYQQDQNIWQRDRTEGDILLLPQPDKATSSFNNAKVRIHISSQGVLVHPGLILKGSIMNTSRLQSKWKCNLPFLISKDKDLQKVFTGRNCFLSILFRRTQNTKFLHIKVATLDLLGERFCAVPWTTSA